MLAVGCWGFLKQISKVFHTESFI